MLRSAPAAAAPDKPATELGEGDLIGGSYKIRRALGQGGMGKIFAAQDQLLQRQAAVKVPFNQEGSVALAAEARALAALQHPHLPQVYHIGKHADLHFMVMEHLRGESLEQMLQRRNESNEPLGLLEAIEILTLITEALHAIHNAGIVHRDIKPDNVMLVRDRGPVLIDFGLVMPQSNPGSTAMTSGSPYYASPEMIRGTLRNTTGRQADLYSFGVMAYELLTGRPPFHAEDLQTLLEMHLAQPIPDVRLLRPDTPVALAELIEELMHKEHGQRPESAEEVVWRLQGVSRKLERHHETQTEAVVLVTQLAPLAADLSSCIGRWIPRASVELFDDADEALTYIATAPPRLLIVDMKLDGMSGVELLMHAQGLDQGTTIVALVLNMRPEDLQVLRKMGVICCLPIGPTLPQMLEPVLRNAFARDEGGDNQTGTSLRPSESKARTSSSLRPST